MYSDSISAKFVEITNSFLKTIMGYMENNVWGDKYIQCPRVDYKNQKQFQNIEHIHWHLLGKGYRRNYNVWNKHGKHGEDLLEELS
jgi:uncharacterized C2H2 Zn-finger protein